jgi:serine phosphatase RsbU (regulator of sigma subunit)
MVFCANRFKSWSFNHTTKPLDQPRQAFRASLAAFMGSHPQRDAITIVSFLTS